MRNNTVLTSVSRNELIHTVHDRQLNYASLVTCSETHSPHASTYALYQPTHGTTRRGRPRLNYVDYIERLTGMKTNELVGCHKTVKPGVNLWSRVLIYNCPTRERKSARHMSLNFQLYRHKVTLCTHTTIVTHSTDSI